MSREVLTVNTFGAMLKQLRVSYGLTQPEFAQILSKLTGVLITRSAVSMWELGQRTPKMDIISVIADYFSVSTDTLLGRQEPSKELWSGEGEDLPEIRMIGRASKKMTPDQRRGMVRVLKIMFPDAFKED